MTTNFLNYHDLVDKVLYLDRKYVEITRVS